MKVDFDYWESVQNIAATVCDKEGVVLYQNRRAIERDGDVVGKNLYACHSKKSGEMIHRMIENNESNTYEIIRQEKRKLIHQAPWYEADGKVGGLIEMVIDLPENMPVIQRNA